jgi:hypothetical protein
MHDTDKLPDFDAGTYQKPLAQLAEVLAQKLRREAPSLLRPPYAATDMHVLMRMAMRTYDLLHYINADDRRATDTDWRMPYSITTLSLVRNMIDCLYNITAILQDPSQNAPWYRKSGFKKALQALNADEERYGGQPKWDDWIHKSRDKVSDSMRATGFTESDVIASQDWPTMGKYLSDKKAGGLLSDHQQFLKTFTYGFWKEYSAIAHGGFEGMILVGAYYVTDFFPIDEREKLEETHISVLSLHVPRAAQVLLCIVTEVQAHFGFEGADINKRIHAMWEALIPMFDARELYEDRYKQLMIDRHIDNW